MTATQFNETEVLSLNGKAFAMLNERESECLKFYRQQGRKYGIQILIENNACADELSLARSNEQVDEILKRAGSTITVIKNSN